MYELKLMSFVGAIPYLEAYYKSDIYYLIHQVVFLRMFHLRVIIVKGILSLYANEKKIRLNRIRKLLNNQMNLKE